MNRIVIIGNGFDLAHGLKTDYCSFLLLYFKNCLIDGLEKSLTDKRYEDELITIDIIQDFDNNIDIDFVNKIDSLDEIIKLTNRRLFFKPNSNPNRDKIIRIKSDFFEETILHGYERKWVDIESIFFSQLMKIAKFDKEKLKIEKNETIEKLNNELFFLIQKFKEYLTIEKKKQNLKIDSLYDYFGFPCYVKDEKGESYEPIFSVPPIYPEHTWFVNFNYTQRDIKYNFFRENISRIDIHGTLDENNIVFGYGDEIGNDYTFLENLDDNRFLKFVKYFYYLQTQEYERLMYAINLKEFEVFIWGHSCGLSDRTLLSKIFQNKKCKKIRFFYYENEKGNNYTDVSQNISRHFVKKEEFLEKMVYFKDSRPFPQIKND